MSGPADAFYEWLLSDAPAARAERERRRHTAAEYERRQRTEVAAICERILADPRALDDLRTVAVISQRALRRRVARDLSEAGLADEVWVRRERDAYATARRVAGERSYRYPARYLGASAADQPIPAETAAPAAPRVRALCELGEHRPARDRAEELRRRHEHGLER